ncbi:hypothetical protein CDAR_99011 [Caerostris darwini]|uniref:Uncharacterized protein n=1 Tax=Caerostris darwini TaxID=1538125 RepID=A0AAV4Q2J0_9ARAC|nr:hypothetical protein CDAR_99011 [Caerostris darwini]
MARRLNLCADKSGQGILLTVLFGRLCDTLDFRLSHLGLINRLLQVRRRKKERKKKNVPAEEVEQQKKSALKKTAQQRKERRVGGSIIIRYPDGRLRITRRVIMVYLSLIPVVSCSISLSVIGSRTVSLSDTRLPIGSRLPDTNW